MKWKNAENIINNKYSGINTDPHGKCLLSAGWSLRRNIHSSFLSFFFFKDVCTLKPHRKCHYTRPREFVNSLFETLRQEKAIFKWQNLLYHEYLLPNVSCSCKNLRRCNFLQQTAVLGTWGLKLNSPLGHTSVRHSPSLQLPALWHNIHPTKYWFNFYPILCDIINLNRGWQAPFLILDLSMPERCALNYAQHPFVFSVALSRPVLLWTKALLEPAPRAVGESPSQTYPSLTFTSVLESRIRQRIAN